MTQTVELPLWLFVLIVLFAAVTFASHFLFPSVRWFFRRRLERAVARLNERLTRPIEPFKLARRYDMIQRLIYDPDVSQAIVEHAAEENVPENVASEKARRYAREIVPSFSAFTYFSFGARVARWLATALYDVRTPPHNEKHLSEVDPDATVIFVMNHRSNMDYVLVTYLVAEASALSYAVGEWARVWPLSRLIKMMGAYFIRRKSRNELYRQVLARYVRMATRGGVTQAIFPEGGLSLDGRLAPPKLGLLSYVLDAADMDKDIVFVPVALNYDRVLEDQVLISAAIAGERRFRASLREGVAFALRQARLRIKREHNGFGSAAVCFGKPLALSSYGDQPPSARHVAQDLMHRIGDVVPVLPVPLVCYVLVAHGSADRAGLTRRVSRAMRCVSDTSAAFVGDDAGTVIEQAFKVLRPRKLITDENGLIEISPTAGDTVRFYAQSVEHLFDNVLVNKD